MQYQEHGTGLTLSTVDSQPARPAPVSVASEPVTYVPPFTATCPIPNQPPIFAAEPSTNQAATVTLHLERTVTEPSLYHSMVALTAMTKSAVETYPSSLESLRDSTHRNPLNFAKGIELQATISNPVNPVSSENVMSMTTLSHLRLSPSENYPTPTAVVTQPQHLIPATCQPTSMSTSLYPVSRTCSQAESAPPRVTPATVVGLQYDSANQGQVPTKEMCGVVTSSSPQRQLVMVTTPTTVGLQSVSNKPLSSLPVILGSRDESKFTSPSSRGHVTSLRELSPKRIAYSDSDLHMQVDSMNTSLASRGIISCDLLPPPTPSEEDLVKASVAGLHYATTLQAQSLSNVQESTRQACTSSRLPLYNYDQYVSISGSYSSSDEDFLSSINPSEAGDAFRKYRDDLLIAISEPLILANSLYSKWIISQETLDKMMLISLTFREKNFILLNAVEARIRTNPHDFLIVIAVLGRYPHLCVFAEGLRNSYCEFNRNSNRLEL